LYNNAFYTQPQQVPPQQQRFQNFGLKGRPVASLEEVRASSIDFDGSIFFFPDLANKRIYTKQINMDGTATINMYELKEMPVQNNYSSEHGDFITRQEFEEALINLKNTLLKPSSAPTQETLNF
jgi:hypothetical protein